VSDIPSTTGVTLSIVTPVHNEQQSLEELFRRLQEVLDELGEPAEVIVVDDGSRDSSYSLAVAMNETDPRFKAVQLSRNFGHQVAITAGLDLALGDAVVIMDSDLQHPPELIPALVAQWRKGFDIVYAVREDRRRESWGKRTSARMYYRLLRRLVEVDMPPNAGDFRLVDRRALNAFRSLRESNRYVRGMFSWIGYRQTGIPYRGVDRVGGTTKYTFSRMVKLAADGILSFSTAPLRLVLHVGLFVSLCALGIFMYAVIAKIAGSASLPGWASLLGVTAFLGGIQLLTLGMLGLYVGRIYEEVKQRPLYLVREMHGIETTGDPGQEAPALLGVRGRGGEPA
jgi:glycosyltransferase involved in cell wall biosynthesis